MLSPARGGAWVATPVDSLLRAPWSSAGWGLWRLGFVALWSSAGWSLWRSLPPLRERRVLTKPLSKRRNTTFEKKNCVY